MVPTASAECAVYANEQGAEVCVQPPDGMPEEVNIQTPVGGVQYTNPPCVDCDAPQVLHLVLEVAGAKVNAVVQCTDWSWVNVPPKVPSPPAVPDPTVPPDVPDDALPSADCDNSKAVLEGPMSGLQFQHGTQKSCAKVYLQFVVVIQCTP